LGPAGAGLRRRRPAARGALRYSDFGRAAELASFAALTALKHRRRVSSRSAWVHAPTETLRSSPSPTQPGTGRPQALWGATVLGGRWWQDAGIEPATCRAPHGALLGREPGSMPGLSPSPNKEPTSPRKAVGRWAGARLCGGEERKVSVGARTRALRNLTRRGCSSATNAVSEASSAARPKPEHRSEVEPQAKTAAVARHRPPARGFAHAGTSGKQAVRIQQQAASQRPIHSSRTTRHVVEPLT
jgi:hypothetical protein